MKPNKLLRRHRLFYAERCWVSLRSTQPTVIASSYYDKQFLVFIDCEIKENYGPAL